MTNVVYEKLKKIADAGKYSDTQLTNTTVAQFASAIERDVSKVSELVFAVAKKRLLRERRREKWQAILADFETGLSGLKVTFPKAEVDLDYRGKAVTIFFEGKPSGDEL